MEQTKWIIFCFPHIELSDDGTMGNSDEGERLRVRRVTRRHKIKRKFMRKDGGSTKEENIKDMLII